jgi:hypothetical protein
MAYQKSKIHRGKMAKCKLCMDKIAAQDPIYAAQLIKSAQPLRRGRS